jgi:hypothetical protein
MKKRERDIREKLKTDFIHYAEKCLKIRTKAGAIWPLKLNAAQLHIHACLEKQLQEKGRVRALVLKGRQQGCSTYVEARFYWKVTHQKGVRAFILTHLDDASRNIYQIVKRFHENCPAAVKPHTGFSNSRELVFDRLDSGYQVGTAKSSGVGRSNTLQYFHGSEVAYRANGVEICFTAGYGKNPEDVPAALRQGMRLIVAHLYEHRGEDPESALEASGAGALFRPFRAMRL